MRTNIFLRSKILVEIYVLWGPMFSKSCTFYRMSKIKLLNRFPQNLQETYKMEQYKCTREGFEKCWKNSQKNTFTFLNGSNGFDKTWVRHSPYGYIQQSWFKPYLSKNSIMSCIMYKHNFSAVLLSNGGYTIVKIN